MSWDVALVEIEVTDEDVGAVLDCLRSGWLTMGPRTLAFEDALAATAGTDHAVAVSSGTAALHLACRAAGVGPGDEVIVPSFTFVASAHAPRYCGADVVFCDSRSPASPNLDPDRLRGLITARTKAVIAVHFWGYAAEIVAIREICDEHGIFLIEDCAEAIGARGRGGSPVGCVGHLGCFSFFSKKQLAVGEGGAVCSNEEELAATARSLRSHAMTSVTWERHRGHGLGYDITDIGFNYRIDEPRAALGLSRIKRLEDDIEARRRAARAYRQALRGLDGLQLPFSDEEVERASHFVFPVLIGDRSSRDWVRDQLAARGIQTTWYPAVHELSAYREGADPALLAVASELADRNLILPLHASLSDAELELVTDRLAAVLAAPRPAGS